MRSIRLASTLHLSYSLALAAGATACGDNDGTAPDPAHSLTILEGHERTAPAGTAVTPAPAVRVTTSRGAGVAGARVSFAVTSGGGSLSGASPTTGGDGIARVDGWTLGQTAGANTLTVTIEGAPATVTFTAQGVAGPAAALSKMAGDDQTGLAGVTVAVPPAVRVTDQFGNPVAGVAVTFAVVSGGGSVLDGTQESGADGVVRVGAWTLGNTVGAQTLAATAADVASAAVTFSATATELVITPTRDTTFAPGTLIVTRLTIPAGITVTAAGPLTVIAADTLTVAGKLRGDCIPLKVVTKSLLEVSGMVANGCSADPANDPPPLTLVGESGYQLRRGGVIESSGAVRLTNDTTLTAEDFVATGAESMVAAGHGTLGPCTADGEIRPDKPQAKNGAPGKEGKPGRPGWYKEATCRGTITVNGATIRGQDGGHGGEGTDLDNAQGAEAKGGAGGEGGYTLVGATGDIKFVGSASSISGGHGGNGGNARATASPHIRGDMAPGAEALGGHGGRGALSRVEARGSIIVETLVEIRVGDGGEGGKAIARAADGRNAGEGRETPQGGGPAVARGGDGGEAPDKRLRARNVVGAALVDADGTGGRGGDAEAYGGKGGDGAMKPDDAKPGAAGGDVESRGGAGGHSFVRMISGALAGFGGNGGQARVLGGNGGAGFTDCKLPPGFTTGGNGGKGGKLDGKGGAFGTGMTNGVRGSTLVENAGNGGNGGNGTTPGAGGEPGEDRLFKDGVFIDIQPVLTRGTKGKPCLESSVTAVAKNHIVGVTPCPQFLEEVTVRNNADVPMTVTTVVVGTELLRVDGGPIVIPPGGSATFRITFTCARAASVDGQVKFIGTAAGENFVETVVDVRVATMTRAVKLGFPLGTIPAGTEIPLSVISSGKVSGPEGGCPAPASLAPPNTPDHLHSQTLGGITIATVAGSVGPYLDPNQTGCGYGRIILVILPPG